MSFRFLNDWEENPRESNISCIQQLFEIYAFLIQLQNQVFVTTSMWSEKLNAFPANGHLNYIVQVMCNYIYLYK
jgi:hypothetical protein